MLGGGVFSWPSRRTGTISLSLGEAEYKATTQAVQEAVWLHRLLIELGPEKELDIERGVGS